MEELLMCSICIERYHEKTRHPVVLPRCGHSFCRPCVGMLVNGGCLICPTCRADQRIESAESLPTEYTILAIIQAQENSMKETCERHTVKLSFWCRTCNTPTCGECLFEDHPTHSHDVIRAMKYISEIKQNAQDIALKFMDALDDREQNFYKTIFSCTKRISNGLRKIEVLRKDMEDARELMKGSKQEDESINAAISLSEAAKFLGLKWNIQEANYNQKMSEDKQAIIQEEKEAKGREEEKERKRRAVDRLEDEKLLIIKEEKEMKRGLRKSKTMSVLEPILNNEHSKDVEASNNAMDSVKDLIELEEKEKDIPEVTKQKDNESFKKLNDSKDEKVVEADQVKPRGRLARKALVSKQRTSTVHLDTVVDESKKTNDFNEQNDLSMDKDIKELTHLNRSVSTPERSTSSREVSEEVKDHIKPKRDLKKAKSKETKEELERELLQLEESLEELKSVQENIKDQLNEDETSSQGKELTEAIDADSGLAEDSREGKVTKDEEEQGAFEGKLMDFIQVPGFMICSEAVEGRLSRMEWGPQGLHLFCHQFQQVEYDILVTSKLLRGMIPSKCPVIFLELSSEQTVLGRVYIKLWGHLRRAQNFLTLCLGDLGVSYANTKFLQMYNVGAPGERFLGGDYEYNNGRGGRGLMEDLEWNGDYAMPMKAGMVTAAGSGQHVTNSLFLICTQSDSSRNFSCPFGIVYEGLKIVKEAVQLAGTKQLWITECGVLVVPPR